MQNTAYPCGTRSHSNPTIVCILGYGRSGSTLLDLLLGSQAGYVSTGELVNLYREVERDELCSCGRHLSECTFWSQVLKSVGDKLGEYEKARRRVELLSSFPFLAVNALCKRTKTRYRELTRLLFDTIVRVSGADVVVDSSKSTRTATGRFLALSRLGQYNVKAILLIRDLRGVVWSAMKGPGSGRGPAPARWKRPWVALRTAVSWALTNVLCRISIAITGRRNNIAIVRYEELCRDTPGTVSRLMAFIGRGLFAEMDLSRRRVTGHLVAGNRVRFRGIGRVCEDRGWEKGLPSWYTVVASVVDASVRRLFEQRIKTWSSPDSPRRAAGGGEPATASVASRCDGSYGTHTRLAAGRAEATAAETRARSEPGEPPRTS